MAQVLILKPTAQSVVDHARLVEMERKLYNTMINCVGMNMAFQWMVWGLVFKMMEACHDN